MEKKDLKKLTKAQLIRLLLKQQAQKPSNIIKQIVNEHEDIIQPPEQFRDKYKPIPPLRTGKWKSVKPKPVLRKSVKQMVKEYEDIIQPPEQFRDKYKPIPKPRIDRPFQMQNARRPPKPSREPPLPPTPKHEFNFDDDIFQTGNQSLEKFKILAYKAGKIRNSKATQTNSKLKSLRSWMTLKRYITYSKN